MRDEQVMERAHPGAFGSGVKIAHLVTSEPPARREPATSKVIYVDARPVWRETMTNWLSARLPDHEINSVGDGDAALSALDACSGVVLVLYNFGGHRADRSRLAKILVSLTSNPQAVPVAVLADTDEVATVVAALECGVRGYIPTALPAAVMIEAIRLICAGDIYVPTSTLMRQLSNFKRPSAGWRGGVGGKDSLSPRQLQIVECLRRGMANKQIAFDLGMSPGTVKVHLRNIMKKLSVINRTQIVLAMMSSDNGQFT